MLETHGETKGGLNPEAVSRFLSPYKEDFDSETESAKHKDFTEVKVHTQIGSEGRLEK